MPPIRARPALTVLLAATVALACRDSGPTNPKYRGDCPSTVGALVVPDTVTGTLTTASCRLSDGSYADVYTMTLAGTLTTLVIDMGSTDVDAFLFVRDAAGNLVVQDDDSGPDTDARIIQTFAPGTYYVHANTFDANEVGTYTLSVVVQPAP